MYRGFQTIVGCAVLLFTCCVQAEVAAPSRVEVAVMLWTATGEPLPMVTEPMVTGRVGFRGSCTIGMACRERNVGTPKRCRRVVIGL